MIKENLRILVVDDEQDYCDVLKMILEGRGYTVETCNDGREALEHLEKNSFDIVVSDLNMPVMDGYEVLARLRSNDTTKDIKVVMVSALGGKIDIKNAMDLGADGYITKPVVVQKLYDLLDKFIN